MRWSQASAHNSLCLGSHAQLLRSAGQSRNSSICSYDVQSDECASCGDDSGDGVEIAILREMVRKRARGGDTDGDTDDERDGNADIDDDDDDDFVNGGDSSE